MPEYLIATLDEEDLPVTWRAIPASESTQYIGDQFLNDPHPEFAALQVPSTISPRDKNYVVNPNHPKMKEIIKKAESSISRLIRAFSNRRLALSCFKAFSAYLR